MIETVEGPDAGLRRAMDEVLGDAALASRILAQAIEQLPLDGRARVRADVIVPLFEARVRDMPDLRRPALAVVRRLLNVIDTIDQAQAVQRLQAVLADVNKCDMSVNKTLDRRSDLL